MPDLSWVRTMGWQGWLVMVLYAAAVIGMPWLVAQLQVLPPEAVKWLQGLVALVAASDATVARAKAGGASPAPMADTGGQAASGTRGG
ncbi:MAG: hypothetical protein HYU66_00630 [Armatimonadetes bacterium]|nr:hypothetical protein [Armatimonadota bacterium]